MFYELILLILFGILSGTLLKMVTKRRLEALPDISDDEFLKIFNKIFSHVPDEIVIRERRYIAEELEIPSLKLSPVQTFKELGEYSKFSISSRVGAGHLSDELHELLKRAGIEKQKPKEYFPSTVGELIYEIAMAKKIIEDKDKQNSS